jgi:hypothetical protein
MIDSHYQINWQELENQLPLVVGLTDLTEARYNLSQLSHLVELISGNVLAFQGGPTQTEKYNVTSAIYKVQGGDEETFPRYIKATSNYILSNTERQNFQRLSIVDTADQISGLEEKLQQAVDRCKGVFIQPVSQGADLPLELKDRYGQKELNKGKSSLVDMFGSVSVDTFKDFDREFYTTFYSSNGQESDAHFYPGSVPYNEMARLSEFFGNWAKGVKELQAAADLEGVERGFSWKYIIGWARKNSGIYQGIVENMKGESRLLVHKMVLAEYYSQKHLEYHECILNEVGSENLLPTHPYSEENLKKEAKALESLSSVTIDIDIKTQKDIEKEINDCGIKTGVSRNLDKTICWMINTVLAIPAKMFTWSFGLLQAVIQGSVQQLQER